MLPERSSKITMSSGMSSACELVAAQAASSSIGASEPPSSVNEKPPSPLEVSPPVPLVPPAPPAPVGPASCGSSNSLRGAFALQPQTTADQAAASTRGERINIERETIEHLEVFGGN